MLGLACMMLSAGAQAFQLYESDSTGIKGGDLMDRDYWRAKWNNIRLDEAIQQSQPEGAILMEVIGQRQLCDELIKKISERSGFKTWKAHAEQIEHKINPNASRGESFKPGCLWSEINYRESYVNYNYAKVAIQKKDWGRGEGRLELRGEKSDVPGGSCEERRPGGRVAGWSGEVGSRHLDGCGQNEI